MNKQIPSYLRLVTDTSLQPHLEAEDLAALTRVASAFEQTTGWHFEFAAGPESGDTNSLMWSAPVDPGVGTSPGHIRLTLPDHTREPRVALEQAAPLAEACAGLWGELWATRLALVHREAELATGVPLVARADDEQTPSFSSRIESVLRGGAEAVGCQAAALYLLDPATTELKLRASFGLPRRRLAEPARPLRPALADLEALLGHAVVLNEPVLFDYWKVPETGYAACACVPVSSPSMPLGTLWVFSKGERDFNDAETNILEVVAGRLAADLERETLIDEALVAREQVRQVNSAHQAQQDQLPRTAPLVEGWDIAALAPHAGPLGGTFFDWRGLPDGSLSLVAGDAGQRGVEAALVASTLRGAARTWDPQRKGARQLLETANSILWTGSTGTGVGLVHAIVDQQGRALTFALGGSMRMLEISVDEFSLLAGPAIPLGLNEELKLVDHRRAICPGELVLAYGTSFLDGDAADPGVLAALDTRLALALEPRLRHPAEELIAIAADVLQSAAPRPTDRVVVILKRRER